MQPGPGFSGARTPNATRPPLVTLQRILSADHQPVHGAKHSDAALRHPDFERPDRSSLRHVVHAGALIPRPDQIEAIEKLGTVLVRYHGSGEILGGGTVLPPRLHRIVDGEPLCPGCVFRLS